MMQRRAPGRPPRYAGRSTITVLVTRNPKRLGSRRHARFALYRTGQTVDEYVAAGGHRLDLGWDIEHQYIKVSPPGGTDES